MVKEIQLEEARRKRIGKERDLKYYKKKLEQMKLRIDVIEKDIHVCNILIKLIEGNDIEAAQQYKDLLKSDYSIENFIKDYTYKDEKPMPSGELEKLKQEFMNEYNKGEKTLIDVAEEFREKE